MRQGEIRMVRLLLIRTRGHPLDDQKPVITLVNVIRRLWVVMRPTSRSEAMTVDE